VPDVAYALTEPTHWHALNRPQASFRGRLIGGCIDTLMHTAGTPHGDLRRFIAAGDEAGTVLFLENADQSPTELVRALHRLRWAGWLDGLSGLLIGRSAAPDSTGATELRYRDALQTTLAGLPCPVLIDCDIGHLPPQLLLINGAQAAVRWHPAQGGAVVQWLT
jgi:muramoyltetrapeptide carboxypeptidase